MLTSLTTQAQIQASDLIHRHICIKCEWLRLMTQGSNWLTGRRSSEGPILMVSQKLKRSKQTKDSLQ